MSNSEYVRFQLYIRRLRSIYLRAICAFHIFETIEELRAPNVVGKKEANENVTTMSSYNNFFQITRHALNFYFLIDLARMLDTAKQSLHLDKLINFAGSNRKKINVDEFKRNNQNRSFLQELANKYSGIQKEDLEHIKAKLEKTKLIIDKVIKYRDQNLAHEDLIKQKVNIPSKEIYEIFDLIAEILNIFSYKTEFSTTTYKLAVDDCIQDTKNIISNLKKSSEYNHAAPFIGNYRI